MATGWRCFFQTRTIRRELGVPPETVSRQGCRLTVPRGRYPYPGLGLEILVGNVLSWGL